MEGHSQEQSQLPDDFRTVGSGRTPSLPAADSGKLIWITGLAGSGKSTIARRVHSVVRKSIPTPILLDGDEFRKTLGDDLGYDPQDRLKNAWRLARFCRLLVSQGASVVCATVSLYWDIHEFNRQNNRNYFEVLVECPMEELVRRDQKGLYTESLQGKNPHVVGITLPFELPKSPDLVVHNERIDHLDFVVDTIAQRVLSPQGNSFGHQAA